MDKLKRVLEQHDFDVSTLQVMHHAGAETLYLLTGPGSEAISLWQRLRSLTHVTGYWPVVIGTKDEVDTHRELIEYAATRHPALTVRQIIAKGLNLDPQMWLQERRAECEEDPENPVQEMYVRAGSDDVDAADEDEMEEDNAMPFPSYVIPYGNDLKPLPTVTIGLLPTQNSWETPAYLRYGDWNACPSPAEHVCMLKYWHDLYGAEVVCMSHDVIETQVARPPQDMDNAWHLAREQFYYCDDIVFQGVGTVWELALDLKNKPTWYFWWD